MASLNDRLLAARHSLAGQGLAKSVCKATTEEMIGPKKKHLDCKYLQIHSVWVHVADFLGTSLVGKSRSAPINRKVASTAVSLTLPEDNPASLFNSFTGS